VALRRSTDQSQQGRDPCPGSQGGPSPKIDVTAPPRPRTRVLPSSRGAPAVAVSGRHSTEKPPPTMLRPGARSTARAERRVGHAESTALPPRRQDCHAYPRTLCQASGSPPCRHLSAPAKTSPPSCRHVVAGQRCQQQAAPRSLASTAPTQKPSAVQALPIATATGVSMISSCRGLTPASNAAHPSSCYGGHRRPRSAVAAPAWPGPTAGRPKGATLARSERIAGGHGPEKADLPHHPFATGTAACHRCPAAGERFQGAPEKRSSRISGIGEARVGHCGALHAEAPANPTASSWRPALRNPTADRIVVVLVRWWRRAE